MEPAWCEITFGGFPEGQCEHGNEPEAAANHQAECPEQYRYMRYQLHAGGFNIGFAGLQRINAIRLQLQRITKVFAMFFLLLVTVSD